MAILFNLFRLCRKDEISFDTVGRNGDVVAKNENSVESTFDLVKRIVRLVAFDNVASTLLLVRTRLNVIPNVEQSSSFIHSFILFAGKQIKICSRKLHIAGTTRLKNSTNSRPKGNIATTKEKSTNTKYGYKTKHIRKFTQQFAVKIFTKISSERNLFLYNSPAF